jgi:hypothetical protein
MPLILTPFARISKISTALASKPLLPILMLPWLISKLKLPLSKFDSPVVKVTLEVLIKPQPSL